MLKLFRKLTRIHRKHHSDLWNAKQRNGILPNVLKKIGRYVQVNGGWRWNQCGYIQALSLCDQIYMLDLLHHWRYWIDAWYSTYSSFCLDWTKETQRSYPQFLRNKLQPIRIWRWISRNIRFELNFQINFEKEERWQNR